MKRSQVVTLGTVGALAAAFSACGEEETAYCIDENEEVVDNEQCDDDTRGAYVWFFSTGSFKKGTTVRGKAGERISAANKSALAARNGFGATGRSTGGGGVGVKTGSSSGGS